MHIAGVELLNEGRAHVIAEIGSNHDGSLERALALIDMSASAGAAFVKFQLFRAADLYPRNVGVVDSPAGAQDFYALLVSLELPVEWLPALRNRCTEHGVGFLVTPFSWDAVTAAAEAGVDALKIASPELTDLVLLHAAAATGIPVIASTGMASLADVDEAVRYMADAGAEEIALLHCVTAYPTPPEEANAAAVRTLHVAFEMPSGLSDHTLDPIAAPIASVSVGGCLIEKHVTLDRSSSGPDHPFAIEPPELAYLCEMVDTVSSLPMEERVSAAEKLLGPETLRTVTGRPQKRLSRSERVLARVDRRSIRAARDLPMDHVIKEDDVVVLRGERNLRPGLHPRYLSQVVGTRLTGAVPYGEGIRWEDLTVRP